MRGILIVLCLPAVLWADAASDLAEKIMQARGGTMERMTRFRNLTSTSNGTLTIGKESQKVRRELSINWPDSFMMNMQFLDTKRFTIVTTQGDQGWMHVNGSSPEDLTIDKLNDILPDAYGIRVIHFLPLLERNTRLTAMGPVRIGGEAFLGLKSSRRGWPEITFLVDEKTYLIKRVSYTAPEAGINRLKEYRFDEYKEFSGYHLPTRELGYLDGQPILSYSDIRYQVLDALDKKIFAKPK